MMSARFAGDGSCETWKVRFTLLATTLERPPRKMFAATPTGLTTKLLKFSVPRSQPIDPMAATLPAFMQDGTASALEVTATLPISTTSEVRARMAKRPIWMSPPYERKIDWVGDKLRATRGAEGGPRRRGAEIPIPPEPGPLR